MSCRWCATGRLDTKESLRPRQELVLACANQLRGLVITGWCRKSQILEARFDTGHLNFEDTMGHLFVVEHAVLRLDYHCLSHVHLLVIDIV